MARMSEGDDDELRSMSDGRGESDGSVASDAPIDDADVLRALERDVALELIKLIARGELPTLTAPNGAIRSDPHARPQSLGAGGPVVGSKPPSALLLYTRDCYYSDPLLFCKQAAVDSALNLLASMLHIPRDALRVVASAKGLMAGPLRYCEMRAGTGPDQTGLSDMDAEPPVLELTSFGHRLVPVCPVRLVDTTARLVLLVEKDTVFERLLSEGFLAAHPDCLLVTGKGFPDVATRRLVAQLSRPPLSLPVYFLGDGDAHGAAIACTYALGSRTMDYDSARLITPRLRWLGVFAGDAGELGASADAALPITERDRQTARGLLKRETLPDTWRAEIESLMDSGAKHEIEAVADAADALVPAGERSPVGGALGAWVWQRIAQRRYV